MKKLLLGACIAAACWTNDTEAMWIADDAVAMKGKDIDGKNISISKCGLGNILLTNRWELGNNDGYVRDIEQLHITYQGTIEKKEKAVEKADFTEEMTNLLYTLPDYVGSLTNLKVLYIYGDRRKYSPIRDGNPPRYMCLKVLPSSIGNLVNLKKLYLSGNELKTLPKSIGNLKNLKILDLSKNCLRALPESIGNLKNLKELSLHENYLETLPESIGNLKNLTELSPYENRLKTLPESIGNLENLKKLDLCENREFSKLPDSIGDLKNLKILRLWETNLESLPESLEELTNLEDLLISRSVQKSKKMWQSGRNVYCTCYEGESYPVSWCRNVIDQSLKYWSCPTPDFDNGLRVAYFNLSGKNLKQIPLGVYLTKAKVLDISNNKITKIPPLLNELRFCLEELYLHNNPNLNHLPDFLWNERMAGNLKKLKIDGKLVKYLPENAEISLADENLEEKVRDHLLIAYKNNTKMSDEELSKITGPYIVHLK